MATVMPKTANWFRYFPEDYRWSSAVGRVLGGAATEEGGSQHCQRDYLTHGNSVIFDWLAEKL